jgi:hypothetical protein
MPQSRGGIALHNYSVEPQPRHLDLSNHIAFRQDVRFREAARLFELLHFKGLIRIRIREDEAGVPQGENTEGEKKVASTLQDVP